MTVADDLATLLAFLDTHEFVGDTDIDAAREAHKRLAAELAHLREERDQAAMWFENHMVDEDGKPEGLTAAGMLNYVYGWGLSGWAREPQSYREGRLVRKWQAAEARCARLQQALREPCAECGHIDWRELG